MLTVLALHLLATVSAPFLVRLLGRRAFWLLALPSLATAGFAASQLDAVRAGDHPQWSHPWVPSIDLTLGLRMDSLSLLMCLVVGGIGTLVLAYCTAYFDDGEADLGRLAAHLTAFAGAMTGLVLADDLLLLYLFWEATTVLSYLLVGHNPRSEDARNAATQALVVTTAGGLAMLGGLLMLSTSAGTSSLTALLADPPTGPTVAAGIVLVLAGAITKSAQVPFHFWLPGAMAAPTPVSAYLHAAAMVKAGIYLVARLAPGFAEHTVWRPTVLVLGGLTMLVGGYRALRQVDLKLILAYGTVSQLGFLIVLVGTGTHDAALAGLTLLVAHAVFKAGLFLSVGTIDHATGTRDVRRLSGLARQMPVLVVATVLCAASMAGLPPMLGFVGKEAVYETYLHAPEDWGPWVLAILVLGSVLTVGYSGRLLWGAWATKRDVDTIDVHQPSPVATAIPLLLGLASLAAAPFSSHLEGLVTGYREGFTPGEHPIHLGLWHGLGPALYLSIATLATGALLVALRRPVARVQGALPHPPAAVSAYRLVMRGLDRGSLEVTGFLQRGSLPLSLGLVLAVFIGMMAKGLVRTGLPRDLRLWDHPAQVPVALVAVVAAIAAVRSRRRLRAVVLVSVTGYACSLAFLLHGAPDLALTQVLAETVSIVIFVLVLRRLAGRFNEDPSRTERGVRILLGTLSGALVTVVCLVAGAARTADPSAVGWPKGATSFGGGGNIVNVALVDIRAWDTMGEISVVLVAATGIASLVFRKQERVDEHRQRLVDARAHRGVGSGATNVGSSWLATGHSFGDERGSLIFAVITRIIFHTVLLWSLYLLFTGHNAPGGGFAAGIVAGLALVIRYLAGGGDELRAALPVMPGALLGTGLFLSAGFGLVSMLAGGDVLQSWIFDLHLPLLGDLHLVTSVFFDIGVYLVVIGLVLDILRSLGSGIDDQIVEARREAEEVGA
ncbi:multisubunit sodium/proton antiporter MrpA subunit /multisubunit sodium/proton antiporter MrpB subunit [Luteococcus japonicus]|uniref:Na(+) H(+) antiporter subunit A Na(+) H(+) antiporter subunit B n=2 Tax=Luteococcus japonicus TaxID=33984 RepID=A0A1R4J0H2_9ACTN|nr:Na+/H+ antiporter subunit A [Luteococcus japonicus]ROR54068.1 multisubunit sodium/proton antiporter MrpA subunit /multisubunit sodium/proton antiporter MrpB subunit [Luteococcus japonicus]SJN25651.1 Na(+) H(+) antiporter subunit A; Na(+) H(+) antiporter subunit B [Luteococcus japonicus LSP_Lj1]